MNYQFDPDAKRSHHSYHPPAHRQATPAPGQEGERLDPATREDMEARFNHDFSGVQIHTGANRMPAGANASTAGQHISFRSGRYSPQTPSGRTLLAHELAHVVQQDSPETPQQQNDPERDARRAAQAVVQGDAVNIRSSVPAGSLQFDNGDQEDERRWRLHMPRLGESLGPRPLSIGRPGQWQIRMDPEIQAQIQAMQFVRSQLSIESLEQAIAHGGAGGQSETAPDLSPETAARSVVSPNTQPDPFSVPVTPARPPLVPAGRGPERPRPASISDILHATLRIPSVRDGIARLQEQASERVRRDWSRLSTGERALVISQGIVIGAGALTGIALSPDARRFALDQIQGRNIPVPGLPVTFRFNLTGENQHLMIMTNIGQLLPPSLGFR